jgi:hypothetical protein
MTKALTTAVATLALTLFAGGAFAQTAASAGSVSADLQKDWTALKDTMLKLGAAMPADKFSFKPKPELRTFAEQLTHVAGANINFVRTIDPKVAAPTVNLKATEKDEVLKVLAESFDFGSAVLKDKTDAQLAATVADAPRFLGPSTAARLVYRAMGHTWDEYGVMTVYLRLNDIVPPASQR